MKSELDLVEWLKKVSPRRNNFLSGIGDDCALVSLAGKKVIIKTDQCVEGTHFLPGTPPEFIGRKAFNRVASDFAAAGGNPIFFLMTVATSRESYSWLKQLITGAVAAGRNCSAILVGGDLTKSRCPLVVTVTAVGTPFKNFVSRSGASAGSKIYVSGPLGGSIRGKHLTFKPRIPLARKLVSRYRVDAMCDISDGFILDLSRICKASGVSAMVDLDRVPINRGCTLDQALHDGEDYELIVVSKAKISGLHEIGRTLEGGGIVKSTQGGVIPVKGHLFLFDRK